MILILCCYSAYHGNLYFDDANFFDSMLQTVKPRPGEHLCMSQIVVLFSVPEKRSLQLEAISSSGLTSNLSNKKSCHAFNCRSTSVSNVGSVLCHAH